jgi:hypothetical protein
MNVPPRFVLRAARSWFQQTLGGALTGGLTLKAPPALSPAQAADLVLRPLVTHEKQLGTWLGSLFGLAHIVAPDALEHALSAGHRLLAEGRT